MIYYIYEFDKKTKQGVLNSDNELEVKDSVPKGSKYWILNKFKNQSNITDENYSGIGTSEILLFAAKDCSNTEATSRRML